MHPELELLSRYREQAISLREFEEHMDMLSRPIGPRGLTGLRSGGERTNDPESASRQLEDGLEQMLSRKREALQALKPQVLAVLSRVTKPAMLQVLVGYYMLGLSNEAAGEYACVTGRQAIRLRKEFEQMGQQTPS